MIENCIVLPADLPECESGGWKKQASTRGVFALLTNRLEQGKFLLLIFNVRPPSVTYADKPCLHDERQGASAVSVAGPPWDLSDNQ